MSGLDSTTPNERFYTDEEWPHGLRCADCDTLFVEGQPISERLESFIYDVPCVLVVCVFCAISGEPSGAS